MSVAATEIISPQIDLRCADAFGIAIQRGVTLAPYTTMKVGGPAQYFATVKAGDQLIKLVRWARGVDLPYFIFGGGSNMLISDAGIRGLVIYNRCRQVRSTNRAAVTIRGMIALI